MKRPILDLYAYPMTIIPPGPLPPRLLGPLVYLFQKLFKHLLLHATRLLIHALDQSHDTLVTLLFIRGEFRGDVNVARGKDRLDDLFGRGRFTTIVFL